MPTTPEHNIGADDVLGGTVERRHALTASLGHWVIGDAVHVCSAGINLS